MTYLRHIWGKAVTFESLSSALVAASQLQLYLNEADQSLFVSIAGFSSEILISVAFLESYPDVTRL